MAHISEFRVRETTTIEGTADVVLEGAFSDSIPFGAVMAPDDTCDYVIGYKTVYEAGRGTMGADGVLRRTTIYRAKHITGTVNTLKVNFPPGVKTIIMVTRPARMLRGDVAQQFSDTEKAQLRANAPPFATGVRMLFVQTTPPTGWAKVTDHDDKALRIVSGTAGSGGNAPFSTVFGRTATDGRTMTEAQTASHPHGVADPTHPHTVPLPFTGGTFAIGSGGPPTTLSNNSGGGVSATANHAPTNIAVLAAGGSQPHDHPIELRVRYVDAIIAEAL